MPSFDQHAFISYAHLDNQPLEPGQPGWVSRFHAALQTLLSQRLGEEARVWRDDKLAGNDVFADEIVSQFPKTALLLSVLTPRYLKSEWCRRELEAFTAEAERSGGLRIGNAQRVFKVAKTPLAPGSDVPPVIQRTLGIAFYEGTDSDDIEFDPALGEHARQAFLQRIYSLAVQMAGVLRALQEEAGPRSAQGKRTGLVVYLAECGRDLAGVREQLATDLRLHGHEVLPERPLPASEEAARRDIGQALARSTLAVHLMGESGGPVPEGPGGLSLVELQNELGADQAAAAGLRRVIWLPEGVTGERAEYRSFLEQLQRSAAMQAGADLLRGDVEALKGAMHDALLRPLPAAATVPVGPPAVHLAMMEADRTAAVPLVKAIRANGFRVTTPVFAGDAASLRQKNAELVGGSCCVVLLYATGDEAWKQHQMTDLRKQLALSRRSDSLRIALLQPETPDKLLLQAQAEPDTVDILGGAIEPALASLAQTVRAAGCRL